MSFELAPLDGLDDEQLTEMANLFAEKCQKAAQQTDRDAIVAGKALNTIKQRIPHGQWGAWLGANFDYSRQTAGTYMTLAANVKRFTFEPESIRQAMAMIAEEACEVEEPQEKPYPVVTPRAERKTGRVEVVTPSENHVTDVNEKVDENAVPAEPKTNTKHSKQTAKAKEADRPAPAVVTPEFVDEPQTVPEPDDPFRYCTFDTIIEIAIGKLSDSDDQRKQAAKRLRKLADKLDPPTKFVKPDLDQCLEFFQSLNSDQGEQFFDFYQSKGWLVGKVAMKDWKAAGRRWIRENEKGTFSNGNGQPRLTTTQQREQNTATAFDRFRQAAADAARIGDRGDVPRRIGAAGVIETDAGAD